jgi:hypothetical protein
MECGGLVGALAASSTESASPNNLDANHGILLKRSALPTTSVSRSSVLRQRPLILVLTPSVFFSTIEFSTIER